MLTRADRCLPPIRVAAPLRIEFDVQLGIIDGPSAEPFQDVAMIVELVAGLWKQCRQKFVDETVESVVGLVAHSDVVIAEEHFLTSLVG